jgi:plasmid stabilization system protein ParE
LACRVDITEPALADAEDYVRFIRYVGKPHRIVFRLERRGRRVIVLRIYHGSRRSLAGGGVF